MRRPGTVLKVPAISLLAALAPPNETLPVYIEYLRTDFALDEPRVVDSVATYSTRLTDRLWRLKEETPGQFADRLHGWCTGDSQKSKPQVWVEALSDQDPDVCVYGVNALALYVKGLPEDLLRGFRDSSTPNAQKTAAKLLKDWWEANQQRILPDKPGLWFVSPEDEETHR